MTGPTALRSDGMPQNSKTQEVVNGIRVVTLAELGTHSVKNDVWMAIHGMVYDVTQFLPIHPGTEDLISQYGGMDADVGFDMFHEESILKQHLVPSTFVGVLAGSAAESSLRAGTLAIPRPTVVKDDSAQRRTATLTSRKHLSPSVVHLRFELSDGAGPLALPAGKHLLIHARGPTTRSVAGQWNGADDTELDLSELQRKFTPAVLLREDGAGLAEFAPSSAFDLIVRVFHAGEPETYPDGGKLSQYIGHESSLPVGGTVNFSGPFGMHEYVGCGAFLTSSGGGGGSSGSGGSGSGQEKRSVTARKIGMLAGATGLPPMVRVLAEALSDEHDPTDFSLLCQTHTEEEILMRPTIEHLAKAYPSRLKVWYAVNQPDDPGTWPYALGEVDAPLIAEHLPRPEPVDQTEKPLVLMCGPGQALTASWQRHLDELGFSSELRLVF